MTREEAKSEIMQIYGALSPNKQRAIDTLVKIEPCEDCVNRKAVLEQTYLWSKDEFLRVTNPFDYLRKRINSLPPVKPQPKTGHWTKTGVWYQGAYERLDYFECSCCHVDTIENGNYCPNCGARMFEPQESEEA